MTKEKKLSLEMKAKIANGRSRACGKCNRRPCGAVLSAICSQAFIEGFKKGYATHKKEKDHDERL